MIEEPRHEVPSAQELERYLETFARRYREERVFRELVHRFLGLSPLERARLSLGGVLETRAHQRRAAELMRRFAAAVGPAAAGARQIALEQAALERAQQDLERRARALRAEARVEPRPEVPERAEPEPAPEDDALAAARAAVLAETDVEREVRRAIEEQLARSPLLRRDQAGAPCFDEAQLVQRLEEIFLQEIVEGIEAETGAGFLAGVAQSYEGVVASWDEIEVLAELPEVDWVQSMIHGRARGLRTPVFPHLIAGKIRGPAPTSVDSAIAVDTSLSMLHGARLPLATRTALAARALMRRLNTDNETYLAHFNSRLHEVTSVELLREVRPKGSTSTHLALDWMLDKLGGRGPGIAYLITDGEPSLLPRAVEAAGRFREHPHLALRVFLVDGTARAKECVRAIGEAAGERTRVIAVSAEELPAGLIGDVGMSVADMVEVARL